MRSSMRRFFSGTEISYLSTYTIPDIEIFSSVRGNFFLVIYKIYTNCICNFFYNTDVIAELKLFFLSISVLIQKIVFFNFQNQTK